MFIVQEGSAAIYEPSPESPGQERPLRIFRAGETFGEMALIDRQPRTLSARAMQATQMLVLKGDDFRRLLRDPAMALAVMASQNDRIRYTTDFLGEVRDWMGRIASGQHETVQFFSDMQDWVRQVAEGEYPEDAEAGAHYRDPIMATLAAEFARMATQVKQREDALRREIAELKIEIDQIQAQKAGGRDHRERLFPGHPGQGQEPAPQAQVKCRANCQFALRAALHRTAGLKR